MDTIKVLYIDDEPINLMLFEKMFDKYIVLTADSGLKGLEILKDNPDIRKIFSDMRMPHMNGIEFITRVKILYPDIHCYILTGYEITDEIKQAIASGMVLKYFRKPFSRTEIERTIEEY